MSRFVLKNIGKDSRPDIIINETDRKKVNKQAEYLFTMKLKSLKINFKFLLFFSLKLDCWTK